MGAKAKDDNKQFQKATWYQVKAASFPTLSMYGDNWTGGDDNTAVFMQETNTTKDGQQWQFFPVLNNQYLIRCKLSGSDFYLGANGTVPQMLRGSAIGTDRGVIWNVTAWDDGTYYLTNAANGTNYHLSTKNNAQMQLSSDTSKGDPQRFSFTELNGISNPSYSSASVPALTASPSSSAPAGSTSSSPSSPGSLSGGAIAGIVIGALLGLLLIALGIFFFLRRARQNRQSRGDTSTAEIGVTERYAENKPGWSTSSEEGNAATTVTKYGAQGRDLSSGTAAADPYIGELPADNRALADTQAPSGQTVAPAGPMGELPAEAVRRGYHSGMRELPA